MSANTGGQDRALERSNARALERLRAGAHKCLSAWPLVNEGSSARGFLLRLIEAAIDVEIHRH